jgi:Thioesterase-like superfamily
MSESIFLPDGERFMPTEHGRGPWDPQALHGGAPAALLTAAFERMEPGSELPVARLGFEFLRPIPFGPLTLSTRILRAGRRVQELAGELHAGSELICRASALRVQEVPADLPGPPVHANPPRGESSSLPRSRMPSPESAKPERFALDGSTAAGFGTSAMEMRWLDDHEALGPGRVWMRLRYPLISGQPLTPLTRLAATADFGNGVGAALPFDRFLFINADLTIHLHRPPLGEWIGLDARTLLDAGGTGMADSVLHDASGSIGRAFQTLVVQSR